ncbi:MAG: hypothetical protein WBW04_00375 [Nitrolancea sp.]
MEMALGRQRVLVFHVQDRAERPVKGVDLDRVYARRALQRQLDQERLANQNLAVMSMAWWNGMY